MQAQGSPLVQGAASGAQPLQRLRVLRAFLLDGQRQDVGSVVAVPRSLALELLFQRRAEVVTEPPAADAPATPPAKTTPRAQRRAQESSDAS